MRMPSIQIKKVRFYNLKLVQTKFMCKYPCTGLKKNTKNFIQMLLPSAENLKKTQKNP